MFSPSCIDSFVRGRVRGRGAHPSRVPPARPGRHLVVMAADDVEALATALRNAIAKQGDRVKDVFKALDKDGDGSVSQKEFSDGILGLGLPLAKEQFAHIDGAPSPAPQSCVQLHAHAVAVQCALRLTATRFFHRSLRAARRRQLRQHRLPGAEQEAPERRSAARLEE